MCGVHNRMCLLIVKTFLIRIRDMWLNMAWLTPCDNAFPREALVYTWLPFCEAEEVCASYIISIPEVTWFITCVVGLFMVC